MDKNESYKEQETAEEDMQGDIVVVTDDEGNETYYEEEMVIPAGGKNYAILVQIAGCGCEDGECHCHEQGEEEDDEEDNVVIARIEFDENGEQVYLDPTDEEFAEARAAYEQLTGSWDEE